MMKYKQKVKEQILMSLNTSAGVVISLNGSWGSGKTYFWINDISSSIPKSIYISLFGKNSVDDIKKEIVLKTYRYLKLGNYLTKLPKIEVLGNSIDLSSMASLISEKDFNDITICFDDLERISENFSLSEFLGYISELKEQKKCKVLIINNIDSFKELDERKNNNEDLKNEKIFSKFSEKIIDYNFYYESTIEDNLDIFNDNFEPFRKSKIIGFFEDVKDENKKFNIRLLYKLSLKLKLLFFLKDKNINLDVLDEISRYFFEKIFDIDESDMIYISNLKSELERIYKTNIVDKDSFLYSLEKEVDYYKIKKDNYNDEIKCFNRLEELKHRFLFDFTYTNKQFIKDTNQFFKDFDVVNYKLGIESLENLIILLIKVDKNNIKKYKLIFFKYIKEFIDKTLLDNERVCYLESSNCSLVINKNKILKYYNKKILKIRKNKFSIEKVINILNNYKFSDEELMGEDIYILNNISSKNHKYLILNNVNYCLEIYSILKKLNYKKDVRLNIFHNKLLMALNELSHNYKYKIQIEIIKSGTVNTFATN